MSGYRSITLSFSCCPAYGTLLSTFCAGYVYKGNYADGACGTYVNIIENRSASCGHTGCTSYSYTWYGYETWYDCDGNANYEYLMSGDSRCIDNNYGAGGYWSSNNFSCA